MTACLTETLCATASPPVLCKTPPNVGGWLDAALQRTHSCAGGEPGAPNMQTSTQGAKQFDAVATMLDAAALQRLRELDPSGNGAIFTRVMQAYAASLQRLLEQLAQARKRSDLAAVRHVVHTLKSSSASVGALALSTLCGKIESLAREQRSDGLAPLLDALLAEAAGVNLAVKAILAK